MIGTMITVVGLILTLVGLAATVLRFVFGNKSPVGFKYTVPAIISGLFLIFVQPLTFYAEPGFHYLVQYPTGTQVAVFSPGYHLRWFGDVLPFKQVLSVLNISEQGHANSPVYAELPPIEVRFNDSVSADVDVASRFRLPSNPDQFIKLANEFRTQENLINATLFRNINEVVRNSARMFSAQEYIAGRGGEFESAVLDQITSGVYVLHTRETTVRSEEEPVTTEEPRILTGDDKRVQLIVERAVDANGHVIRKANPLEPYGIEVTQCTISRVNPEEKFKEMLAKQRDAAALSNVERQKAKTAGFEKIRIDAEGEAAKATVRIEQEKKQIVLLIEAETQQKQQKIDQEVRIIQADTRRKQEVINLEMEKLKRDQAAVQAEAIKLMASAEAEKRKKIMEADNALQIRLDTEVKIHQAYAEALKGAKIVPDTFIGGGGSGNNTDSAVDLIQLIKAKLAKDLAERSPSNSK